VHLFGQIGMWQASPVNWASQVHTESIQIPCPEHSLDEVVLGHVFKLKCFLCKLKYNFFVISCLERYNVNEPNYHFHVSFSNF